MYYDKNGLLMTINKQGQLDGGDTAANEGFSKFGIYIRLMKLKLPINYNYYLNLAEVMPFLEPKQDGNFIRHPGPGADFWSDPKQFSRDQQIPLIIALGAYKEYAILWRMFKAHIKRFFHYQNKDIACVEILSLYSRAFKMWPLYPLIIIGDIWTLFNTFNRCGLIPRWKEETSEFVKLNNDDVGDDKNHIMCLLQAKLWYPTPISFIASWIYKKFRPKNRGNTELNETSPIQGAITHYFREESGNNPEISELYRPIIAYFFS